MIDLFNLFTIGGVLAALAALGVGYFNAVAKGRKAERQRQNDAEWDAIMAQDEIETAVAGNDLPSKREEVSKWVKR